jgi:uncharacterized protein with NAD-binding domain and iron-sulfur cluster
VGLPRVVVLGGGMAGLAAAWELSSGNWQGRLGSITVYQRGWRLGGKGASSRGPHGRIEEHGLHVLLGYYDATFRLLREVYGELDRTTTDPACPVRTWRDAVVPTGDVGLADRGDGDWTSFVTRFSGNDALPGEPGAEDRPLTPLDVTTRGLGLLADFLRATPSQDRGRVYLSASPAPAPPPSDLGGLLRGTGLAALAALLEGTDRAARLAADGLPEIPLARTVSAALRSARDDARAALSGDPALRRTWQLVDLVVSCLQGMAADGLLSGTGYDRIDHLDFREWLAGHGAAADTLDSPIVRGMYDLTFAYEGGDRGRPRFAAGLGLQLAGRMLFDFKGSIFWRMQAGMGEIVFAPVYEALARRGVEFRFFHRLDRLRLGAGRTVAALDLTRQADPAPGSDRYEPLVRVGGLPSWPAGPLVDQLEADPGDGLESHAGPPGGTPTVTLRAGEDFDVAVLAVSLGMVPHVAAELVAADPAWRAMVDGVATVATRSAQLWFDATEADLGWRGPPGVTLSGFGDTFDTWASMSHLLPRESWPSPGGPRSIAYLCGAMPDADPAAGADVVRETLRGFLDDEVGALWPRTRGPGGFRWELLSDDAGRQGPDRLLGQYARANLDPSDRYVQSLPGSGRYRLPPGRSGFDNLVVAGDWTACGLDAGCLEAATRSGVLAARAVLARSVVPPAARGTAA